MTVPQSVRWKVTAQLPVQYEIVESADLLEPTNPTLAQTYDPAGGRQLVVVDTVVDYLYGDRIRGYFAAAGIDAKFVTLVSDERDKGIDAVLSIAAAMNEAGAFRLANPPIAIGGGVMLDVVGLAASLYRRGIPYIRVPTTLLGLVDVSVAAKTGINFEGYRNRLGSYSPPLRTLIDRSFLGTLPERQLRNGMGEILKMALIKDLTLFELLEAHGPALIATGFGSAPENLLRDPAGRVADGRPDDRAKLPGRAAGDAAYHGANGPPIGRVDRAVADDVIGRAIVGMVTELQPNLWEKTLERSVDYGHSFSPLLEMRSLPELYHGEAVTLDCVFSAFLARNRGFLSNAEVDRVVRCAVALGLPVWHKLFCDPVSLAEALADTIKHRNGDQHLPVMDGIGQVRFLNDVTFAEIEAAAAAMAELASITAPEDDEPVDRAGSREAT